jgi:hypothetical protein
MPRQCANRPPIKKDAVHISHTFSRDEMRQVERSLANSEQDTRDEIGFLLIHQGFADRFFPGTSVLHTRVRYALFVPWIYMQAATNPRRGNDIDTVIRRLLIELAKAINVRLCVGLEDSSKMRLVGSWTL